MSDTVKISLRIDKSDDEMIKEIVGELNEDSPTLKFTRSDVIKAAIGMYIAAREIKKGVSDV